MHNLGFKYDPNAMYVEEEEMFSGRGNLNSVQIKRNDDLMNEEYSDEAY